MAELLKKELGLDAELTVGDSGEFTVWVGDQMVAKKGLLLFPTDQKVLEAVRSAL